MCWVWKDPWEGRRREVEGVSKGITLSQPILPYFHITSFPLFSAPYLSLSFLPQRGALRGPKVPQHLVSLYFCPCLPLVRQKNNLYPSPSFPLLFPFSCRVRGEENWKVAKDRKRKEERVKKGRQQRKSSMFSCRRTIVCDEIFMSFSRVNPFHTVYYRLHTHLDTRTHSCCFSWTRHTESHTERASESSWKRFVRSPSWNWETENLLHYCCSQLKYCVCVFVFEHGWITSIYECMNQ